MKISEQTGDLDMNGHSFDKTIIIDPNKGVPTHKNPQYDNISERIVAYDMPCEVRGYYKNGRLTQIQIVIQQSYINKNYSDPVLDNVSAYLKFCENLHKKLLDNMIVNKKMNFLWGKIRILTDPREYVVFIEIKYYK